MFPLLTEKQKVKEVKEFNRHRTVDEWKKAQDEKQRILSTRAVTKILESIDIAVKVLYEVSQDFTAENKDRVAAAKCLVDKLFILTGSPSAESKVDGARIPCGNPQVLEAILSAVKQIELKRETVTIVPQTPPVTG